MPKFSEEKQAKYGNSSHFLVFLWDECRSSILERPCCFLDESSFSWHVFNVVEDTESDKESALRSSDAGDDKAVSDQIWPVEFCLVCTISDLNAVNEPTLWVGHTTQSNVMFCWHTTVPFDL